MRCQWQKCGGIILGERCLMCGRSTDMKYEEDVSRQQLTHKHHNWHGKEVEVETYKVKGYKEVW